MSTFSKIFAVLNVVILLTVIVYVAIIFAELPEIIPIHFGAGGEADGFGNKNMIWLDVGIIVLLYALLTFLSTKPQYFNMPEEMKANKPLISLFAHVLCFVLMVLFANLTFETVQVAMGKTAGLSSMVWLFLGMMFLVIISFLAYSSKIKKQEPMA